MFQPDTYDPRRIDTELGWARSNGLNSVRVFLHDLLWAQDHRGFQVRLAQFVDIAARHGIKPVFVGVRLLPADFESRVAELVPQGRPILCTEYLARPLGSTVAGILPVAKRHNVGAFNWGLVAGKTQTTSRGTRGSTRTPRCRTCGSMTCWHRTDGRFGTPRWRPFVS